MTSRQIMHPSRSQGNFLLGFRPFFYKELQEWKRKRLVIATLIILPLLTSILSIVAAKLLALQTGTSLPPADVTLAATGFALSPLWVSPVAILLSIGLIPKELDGGTLAWNLTKPLSRTSFLLGKWLATTLITWLIGIVLANMIGGIVAVIGFGWATPRFNEIVIAHLAGFCCVGFWVLLCLLLGLLLKDQAAVGAGALLTAIGGTLLSNLPDARLKLIAPFYPSNTVDWAVSSPSFLKLMAYLTYMVAMAVAAKQVFDRKEFS